MEETLVRFRNTRQPLRLTGSCSAYVSGLGCSTYVANQGCSTYVSGLGCSTYIS